MKTHNQIFWGLLLTLISASQLQAQCYNFSYEYLDGNKANARFSCGAERFWDLVRNASYEVPRGSGKNVSFAASMWAGGLDPQGGLHLAASTYRQSGNDYYAGPMRHGTPYNCGRGFETPGACFDEGALILGSGKVASFYPNGFQIYDPQTQTSLQRILSNDFANYFQTELPNGDLLLVSFNTTPNQRSLAMVFDTAGFLMPQVDTLYYGFFRGVMTALPTGKVLIAGPFGMQLFDPSTHANSLPATFPGQSSYPGITTLSNGKALLAAGPQLWLYDAVLDAWTAGPAITQHQKPVLVNVPGGDALVMGISSLGPTNERYNPLTNTITLGPNVPFAMQRLLAFPASGQEILISEGDPQANSNANDLYFFNYNTGATRALRFPAARRPIAFDGTQLVAGFGTNTDFVYIDPSTGHIPDQRWQDVWKVSKVQVQQFQQDFASQTINFANYPDIETWPGNGNVWAGEDAQLAPYIDMDNDGVYDPLNDGDHPCFPGDQAIWWVYNDDGPHTESQGASLGIQVENLSYVYDCSQSACPDTAMDYATFHHMEVTNYGASDLHALHLGNYYDFDLGNYGDDFVGSDSSLGMAYVYNGDANDETQAGYGLNPPAFGSVVLPNGQIDAMDGMMHWDNSFSITGNPQSALEHYDYLREIWRDGSPLLNNAANGHQSTGPGAATRFAYSGDGGFCGGPASGWSEVSAGSVAMDRRLLQSFGPLDLAQGESVAVDYALVYSRNSTNDNLGSVCQLKADAATIQNWWAQTADLSCLSLVTAKPDPKISAGLAAQLFPNPNAGEFILRLDQAARGAIGLVLRNMQGQEVWQGTLPTGKQELEIRTSNLPGGLYLLEMNDGKTASMQRVVIAR